MAEPEDEDEVSEDEPLTAAVEKVVRNASGALAPSAIRAVLMQNESYAPRLEKTLTYLYSVLFRGLM